jgi:hypothetical protein
MAKPTTPLELQTAQNTELSFDILDGSPPERQVRYDPSAVHMTARAHPVITAAGNTEYGFRYTCDRVNTGTMRDDEIRDGFGDNLATTSEDKVNEKTANVKYKRTSDTPPMSGLRENSKDCVGLKQTKSRKN